MATSSLRDHKASLNDNVTSLWSYFFSNLLHSVTGHFIPLTPQSSLIRTIRYTINFSSSDTSLEKSESGIISMLLSISLKLLVKKPYLYWHISSTASSQSLGASFATGHQQQKCKIQTGFSF